MEHTLASHRESGGNAVSLGDRRDLFRASKKSRYLSYERKVDPIVDENRRTDDTQATAV